MYFKLAFIKENTHILFTFSGIHFFSFSKEKKVRRDVSGRKPINIQQQQQQQRYKARWLIRVTLEVYLTHKYVFKILVFHSFLCVYNLN